MFCDETLVGDVMSGLKGFAVKFMIRMSQVQLHIDKHVHVQQKFREDGAQRMCKALIITCKVANYY